MPQILGICGTTFATLVSYYFHHRCLPSSVGIQRACENSISRGARFILPINWEQPPPRCDGYLTISRPVLHLSIQQSIHTSWLYPSTKDNWKILSPKTLNLWISQNRLAFECFLFAFWAGSIFLKESPQMFFRQVHMKDIHCVQFFGQIYCAATCHPDCSLTVLEGQVLNNWGHASQVTSVFENIKSKPRGGEV